MNIKDFIAEKKMEFVKPDDDSLSFWGSIDTVHSQKFELFITSEEDGPSQKQIDTYQSFVSSFNSLESEITNRCRALIPIEKQKTFENTPVTLQFVSVFSDNSVNDIDLLWTVYKKIIIFSKSVDFFVQIKDNKITLLELNE